MSGIASHLTQLRLAQPTSIDVTAAGLFLDSDASSWLGSPVPAANGHSRRFLTDLSMPIRDRAPNVTFKKAAFVDLGPARGEDGRVEVEIGWRSSSLAPLFPVFAGKLILTPTELALEGYYAPPGGDLGAVLDKAFLNIAARGTARWLLGRVAEALESDRRIGREARSR